MLALLGGYSRFLLILCILLTSCVGEAPDNSPYSDIFFVNNSAQALSIRIRQAGDAVLVEGEHYSTYAKIIPPYATQHILRINRQLENNQLQDILFSTHIENEKVDFFITQKMQALESGSNLSYGSETDDAINSIMLPSNEGTDIQRVMVKQRDGVTSELAFKVKDKGLYADIYYVLTEPYPAVIPDTSPNTLSVLTYNIWALPFVSNDIAARLNVMPQYLAQYDVLLLQEAFSGEREKLIHTLEDEYGYGYVTNILDSPKPNIFNGGVILLSRFPIVKQAQAYFPDCAGSDCLADKGINYMEIIKHGRSYHIFSAHTASFDSDIARLYRQNQFQQMRDFTEAMAIPKSETVIYGGDFNVNKLLFPEDYQKMLAILDVSEPEYTGHFESTFDPFVNIHATAFGSGGDHIEYLDYVFVSDNYGAPVSTVNNVRVPRSTAEALWYLWDLSDHFPVEAFIE